MQLLSRQVTVAADGTPLSFQIFGQGPERIVLLHGLGGDSSDWVTPQMAEVLETMHATYLAIDMRGHGIDTRYPTPHGLDLDLLCADISAITKSVGWTRYGVIGYSFGGVVSLLHSSDPCVGWSVSGGVNEATVDARHADALAAALIDPGVSADEDIAGTVGFTRARRRAPMSLARLCRALPNALDSVQLDPARHAVIVAEDDDPSSAGRVALRAGGLPVDVAPGDHVSLFLSGDFLRRTFDVASQAGWISHPVPRRPANAQVLVLSGLPGVGKTSVARAVASSTGAARISSDELRSALPKRTYTDAESALVYKSAVEQVVEAARHNPVVVFDATNLRAREAVPDAVATIANAVHRDGGNAIAVTLHARHEVLVERLTTRGAAERRSDDFSEADPPVLETFAQALPPSTASRNRRHPF